MSESSHSDLMDLQKDIKLSLKALEDIVLSGKAVQATEKKQAFLCLKEKIRTLMTYSKYLQTYGDSSFESSMMSQRQANRLAKEKKQVQKRLQHCENEVMILQKRLIEQERFIEELKLMNKLDVSYISSVSFNEQAEREDEEIEECSQNSVLESSVIGSYYSASKSHLKMEEQQQMIWQTEDDNLELLKQLQFLVFSEKRDRENTSQ